MRLTDVVLAICLFAGAASANQPHQKNLPIGLAHWERGQPLPIQRGVAKSPPAGNIHSLGEWEDAEAVMTLWPNASYMKALAAHGSIKVLADDDAQVGNWVKWFNQNQVPTNRLSFFKVPTNSIWIRDYGPWWIVDGRGQVGMVDTIYNRPRPQDDVVPSFISQALGIPNYPLKLVHTGGNYYSDGLGHAFSSTLVFKENRNLLSNQVFDLMKQFLGIVMYGTSPLGENVTIEHLDTFGKLASPDTWVFSRFPTDSRFYQDSENMVAKLKAIKSPYGTPYRIFRLPMFPVNRESYRAYINSFISNRVLYFPTYGDETDEAVAEVYQQALPGYKIVGVDNGRTEWGDSVHCRSRNLIKRDTLFLFPKVTVPAKSGEPAVVAAEIYASPGASLKTAKIVWAVNGVVQKDISMTSKNPTQFTAHIPAQKTGSRVSFYVEASDSKNVVKLAPISAPARTIDFEAP